MPKEFETAIGKQMFDVAAGSGEEIVDANNFMTLVEQSFAEM
jgi:hypothetical protein